ncbi:MAG: DUF2442 domain-containing protein [Candidatus Sumerlaeota bacterium]|nr:DUF2442 domain-containing protein [Candidatus Sumerlaeota bacterium]
MILDQHGTGTSLSEITSISSDGFWLLVDDREYFVPFEDYPAFRSATVYQIYNMQQESPTQFHWPDLDMDIELEALENPEHFPLVWRDK